MTVCTHYMVVFRCCMVARTDTYNTGHFLRSWSRTVVSKQVFNIRLNIPGMCSHSAEFTVARTFIYATSFVLGHHHHLCAVA